jgi:glycosyltransferase involved in cell wall biosynthesis
VADLLRLADLMVAPSRWAEAFALVLAEAAASGVPSVATHVGGIPEVVEHGVTGILVPPADPAALGRALAELLADPERRAAMGLAARQRACRLFSVDAMATATLGHYRRLLDAPARAVAADLKKECAT